MGETKRSCKRWIGCAIFIVTVILVVKISYELKWLDVVSGIFKLESNKKRSVQRISLKTLSYVAFVNQEPAFMQEMAHMGWQFVNHYGRGMIFEKDGYEILITKHVFFNRYAFFEVATREIFDLI